METKTFTCTHCDYISYRESDFNKHLFSIKHKENTEFKCHFCGCFYKHQSNLYRHQKRCSCSPNVFVKEINENIQNAVQEINENVQTAIQNQTNTINTKIENSVAEIKTDIQNQTNTMNTKIDNSVAEINTKIDNQTNTNNNSSKRFNRRNRSNPFNINSYLNVTCKDAINLEDFIKTINPEYDDVVLIGKNGYVEGNAWVIIKHLLNLDQHRRPIQCSDVKRQTVYLKSKNKWEKDADGLPKTSEVVDMACNKIYRGKKLWEQRHPEHTYDNHKKAEEHNHLVQSLSGAGQNVDMLNNKVANKVIKSCTVNKDAET